MADTDQVSETLSDAMLNDGASALTPPVNGASGRKQTISNEENDQDKNARHSAATSLRTKGTDAGHQGGGNPDLSNGGYVGAAEDVIPQAKPGLGARLEPGSF